MTPSVLLNALCEIRAQLEASRGLALQAEVDTGRHDFSRLAARESLHALNARLAGVKLALEALMRDLTQLDNERTAG